MRDRSTPGYVVVIAISPLTVLPPSFILVGVKSRFFRQAWFLLLVMGAAVFLAAEQGLQRSGNLGFLPIVIVIGAFLVPATFVVYFYEYVRDRDISTRLLTTCFLVGGLVGVVAAAVVEFATIRGLSAPSLAGVALIEESAKLIFPVVMFLIWDYQHEADGLLFGVAAGMGFAALETTQYAVVTFVQSHGSIGELQQILLFRGLESPAGHAAWTGLICAMLWRARRKGDALSVLVVAGAFFLAVGLHTSWDVTAGLSPRTPMQWTGFGAASAAIVLTGLGLIIWRLRRARISTLGGSTTHKPRVAQ